MSDNKANQLVAELMATLRPIVMQNWSHDLMLKKEAEKALQLTEKAMLAITKPLINKKFQMAADAAHEYARLIGSLGAQSLLDMVSRLKMPILNDIRPSLIWATARAYNVAGDLSSSHKRFISALQLAIAKGQGSLVARIAIDIGVLAANEGDIKKARKWYEKARDAARADRNILVEALAIHNLATIEQEPDVAQKLLEESLRLKECAGASEDMMAGSWINLGIIFAKAGDYKRAYGLFKKAANIYWLLKDYPNIALSSLNLANASAELNRFDEANRLYRDGLNISRRFGDTDMELLLHQGYATSAFKHSRFKIASKEFRAMHELLTLFGETHKATIALHDQALSEARAGDTVAARETIKYALKQFEAFPDWDWYKRCLLLIATDIEKPKSEARLKALNQAVGLKGGKDIEQQRVILRTLWNDLIDRGLYSDASQLLQREKLQLRTVPLQLKERLHYAGMELKERGRKKEALRLLRQAEKLMNKQKETLEIANVRHDLAIVLAENEKFDEAITLLEQNILLAKQRKDRFLMAVTIGNLGEIKNRAGLSKEAIPLLERASNLSKDLHDAEGEIMWLNNLSLALSDLRRYDKANKVLLSALKKAKSSTLDFDVARILGSFGNIATKSESFDKAAKYYTASIMTARKFGMNDFAVRMRLNRATVYAYGNKRDAAMKDVRKVVQDSFNLYLYDLGQQATYAGAMWAVDWQRPKSAGEFTATNFLCSLMVEDVRFKESITLLLSAYSKFSSKQYQQFYEALRRQLLYSDKSGMTWGKVEQLEKLMRSYKDSLINKKH